MTDENQPETELSLAQRWHDNIAAAMLSMPDAEHRQILLRIMMTSTLSAMIAELGDARASDYLEHLAGELRAGKMPRVVN